MKQSSLFGSLPKINDKMKEINKDIIEKANSPRHQKTYVSRNSGGGKALQAKIYAVIDASKRKLVDDGSTELITDDARLKEYMQAIKKNGIASIDTETTGLDPIDDDIVGISLYTEGEKPVYIPIWHTEIDMTPLSENMPKDIVKEEIQSCIDENVSFIFHNAKFDMRVTKNQLNMDEYLKCHWDTQVAANLLNENEPHGLKQLWNKYVSKDNDEDAETFDKLFEKVPFNFIPLEIAYIYASKDALMTYELYEFQKQFLDADSVTCNEKDLTGAAELLKETEIPLISYLCEMEDTGIGIDEEVAEKLSKKYNEMLNDAEKKVQEQINKIDLTVLPLEQRAKLTNPINANSPQQLAIIFYDAMKLKSTDNRKPRGTGEDILEGMKAKYKEHAEMFDAILEYRGIKKLLSTYIDKIPRLIKETTNKVHTQFNQYGARTGRFSSSDPNLQNIPSRNKEIRKMFIPSKNNVLISCDYSQQEPRVLAHLCKVLFDDVRMMNTYLEGKDLYAWMASEIYEVDYELCKEYTPDGKKNDEGKKRRDSVKSIILGLMYGRGTPSIAEQLSWTVRETERVVNLFFKTFPAIKQVIEYFKSQAQKEGYVSTVYGRKRRLPDINLPEFEFYKKDKKTYIEDENIIRYYTNKLKGAWGREKNEIRKDAWSRGIYIVDNGGKIAEAIRQILNSVIQGTSADITKKAMVEIGRNEELRKLNFKMLLTVHDEIIGESPKETAKRCGDIVSEIMMKVTEDKIVVPMKVDAEYTDRWFGENLEVS